MKEEKQKSIFVTGVLDASGPKIGKGNYKEIHSQINQVLENFDEHIDNILERNEKDFLAAYRGHMVKVQKELEYFKAKTSEQEYRLRMDEHVMKIEKSLEWFREEALKLGKQMNQFKADAQKWKAKCENLEYDNTFLEKQIVTCRRHNKCLKIALGKSQSHCQQLIDEVK